MTEPQQIYSLFTEIEKQTVPDCEGFTVKVIHISNTVYIIY